MNLLVKLFHRKKGSNHGATKELQVKTADSPTSPSKPTVNKALKKEKKRTSKRSSPSSKPQPSLTNVQVVEKFIDMNNNGASKEEFLTLFASHKVKVKFDDTPNITAEMYANEAAKTVASFPDMKFTYDSIEEIKPGRVLLEDLVVRGTHKGVPYGFAHFPPVDTSSKYCVNDPERVWFTIKDGKIAMMEVVALGSLTGPPGFYIQVGGSMEMPPPPPAAGTAGPEDDL